MKILALLQNQWFKDPVRAAARRAKVGNPERWDYYILFAGCLTGRRLQAAFGSDLCSQIIWANASPKIAGQADGVFPADPAHMAAAIAKHHPDLILLFGHIARDGFEASLPHGTRCYASWEVIIGPHPCARTRGICDELSEMASELRETIDKLESAPTSRHTEPLMGSESPAHEGSST